MKSQMLASILELPLIGIVRGLNVDRLQPLIEAVIRGGLRNLEITMNSPGATDQIKKTVQRAGAQLNVGAGTVTSIPLLDEALKSGARFIVTPVVNRGVIRECVQRGVPVFPGASSPTEIFEAWELGAAMVKIFPAETTGVTYIRALKGPFPEIKLLPTGGVDLQTGPEFLRAGAAGLGVGSPLFDKNRIEAEDWVWIEAQTRRFTSFFPRIT